MIIIDNIKQASVLIQRNLYSPVMESYNLTLFNRGTNQSYTLSDLNLEDDFRYGYYCFVDDFDTIPSGEYEYTLTGIDYSDNEYVLSKGVIRVNELNQDNIYYYKNTEYVTYEQ